MLPTAHVEHKLPGRVRLRVASRRGDHEFFNTIVHRTKARSGVTSVAANSRTGSILIRHDGEFGGMADLGDELNLFSLVWPEAPREHSVRHAAGDAPLATASAGLSGIGVYQATQGRLFGSAAESLWQAYSAHQVLGRSGVAFAFAAIGLFQLARGELFGAASSMLFHALSAQHLAKIRDATPHSPGEKV